MTEKEKIEKLRIALKLMLDNVDYRNGSCRVNEMIGAVLPVSILTIVENILSETNVIENSEVTE